MVCRRDQSKGDHCFTEIEPNKIVESKGVQQSLEPMLADFQRMVDQEQTISIREIDLWQGGQSMRAKDAKDRETIEKGFKEIKMKSMVSTFNSF